MAITVRCECGRLLQFGDEFAGRRTICPNPDCRRELVIPTPGPQAWDAASAGRPAADWEAGDPIPQEKATGTSGKSIASLILGLTSIFCLLNLVTGVPAVILGILGLNESNRSRGRVGGKGLAVAGLITGSLGSLLVLPAVLIALLLPAVQAAREAALRARCTNNLKQIGLGLVNRYQAEGPLPGASIRDESGKPLLSWRVAILPYIDQKPLYDKFHLDEPWNSPHNLALLPEMPSTYLCPSEKEQVEPGVTTYHALMGPGTIIDPDLPPGPTRLPLNDSQGTLAVFESPMTAPWTEPEEMPFIPKGPLPPIGSRHPGRANVLLSDGAVRSVDTRGGDDHIIRGMLPGKGPRLLPQVPVRDP